MFLGKYERKLEPFFKVTHYIAEFWNTISNFPFIIIGLLRLWEQYPGKEEFVDTAYQILILIGIGSSIHHATTPKWTIIVDWIPIVIGLYYIYSLELIQYISAAVYFEVGLATSVLIIDHTTNLIPVPWAHTFWHLLITLAFDSFLQSVEKQLLIDRL